MIPKGWIQARIGELGIVQGGRQRSPTAKGSKRPYLRVANVYDGHIDTSDVMEMPFSDTEYETFCLKAGDVLLNEGQSLQLVGRSAIYYGEPKDCCFQNTLIRFQAGKNITPEYAHRLFQFCQYTGKFSAIASQTTSIAHLGLDRFAKLLVRVPPLDEQRFVVDVLCKWERGIGLQEKVLTQKTELREGFVHHILSHKRRLEGFDQPWKDVGFHDFLSESRIVGNDGATAKKLTVKLYGRGVHGKDDRRVGSENTKYYIRRAGQFIYSKLDFLNGAFGIIPEHLDGYETTLDLPCFDVAEGLDARFLLLLVAREEFYSRFLSSAAGGRKARRVNPAEFLAARIHIPELNEQQAIVEAVATLDREIELMERQLTALKRQKQGLMQQLLTGRIRVGQNACADETKQAVSA